MPKILTHKEFNLLSKTSTKPEQVAPTPTTPAPASFKGDSERKKKVEYLFFHPDNGETCKMTGKFIVRIGGEIIDIPIDSGVLTTAREDVRDELKKHGMVYMYEKEIQE
jgi:hypothetical protein